MNDTLDRLATLGFTALEADIYLYLLQNGTSTGYAVSKAIGKAVANTYKGIESLRIRGAVEVSDTSKSRSCRAVPWRQFLASQRASYETNLTALEAALEALPEAADDEAVYQLDNSDRVITAAVEAIDNAKRIVLGDIEPSALPHVKAALERATARGVEVRIKIYEPEDVEGAHITLRVRGREVYGRTNDVALHINADGKEDVLAIFNHDMSRVLQAFTTRSALMNMKHYCALLYELTLTDIKQNLRRGDVEASLKNLDDTDHLQPFSANGPPLEGYIKTYDLK
ncbi:MAG: hypothetical protein HWE25_10025 [Alphaproteobacteria bacterium]|nr:hypothetical protein [Alphaproteobacteria bacterium]